MKINDRVAERVLDLIGWLFGAAIIVVAVIAALFFAWAALSADSVAAFLTKLGVVAGLIILFLRAQARSDTSRVGSHTGNTASADVLDRMLRVGLSYAQVSTLAGNFGNLVSRFTSKCVTATYVWRDPSGARLHGEFEDGRLVVWIFFP